MVHRPLADLLRAIDYLMQVEPTQVLTAGGETKSAQQWLASLGAVRKPPPAAVSSAASAAVAVSPQRRGNYVQVRWQSAAAMLLRQRPNCC